MKLIGPTFINWIICMTNDKISRIHTFKKTLVYYYLFHRLLDSLVV